MKTINVIALLCAQIATTFISQAYADSREIREFQPFATRVHKLSGNTKNFRLGSYGIKNLTTRMEVIERDNCWDEFGCTDYKVLASEKGLQLVVYYTDPDDHSDTSFPELTFNFKWSELPAEIQEEASKPSGGFKDFFGKKHRAKMQYLREHFNIQVREYRAMVKVIDYARSRLCYDDYPSNCVDEIVYKEVERPFKDVSLQLRAE